MDLQLEAYAESGVYPFHMPGHKRNAFPMKNPYEIDITEIDGFDDLHAPEGILKEAMERAAKVYGAKQSYYLVNGSTCGILAAISAAAPQKGKLLMARNSHKSVYHAAYLRQLSTIYLNPVFSRFGIYGAVSPKEVERKLRENPDVDAVILTSPTYEGVVSDIAAIAEITHKYQVPLIVDEAHGAHFGFHKAFPQTSVRLGADLVIQSMHKVLPSLTQTALLHRNSEAVLPERITQFLDIYETSSPSYVLMAGMEKCIRFLEEEGNQRFELFTQRLRDFYETAKGLQKIHVMTKEDFSSEEIFCLDRSKIVISVKGAAISGSRLYEMLLKDHKLQMEMYSGFYVLAMTSLMDREEGFERLYQALLEIDGNLLCKEEKPENNFGFLSEFYLPKEKKMELYEAMERKKTTVSFSEAEGKISGTAVCLYPPGVPALLAGETIDRDFIKNIRKFRKYGLNVKGIADIINERISIVSE